MSDLNLAAVIDAGGPTNHRRSARAAEKRRKRRRRRTWVSVLIGVAVIGAAVAVAWFTIKPVIASMREPNDFPGPGTGAATVTVKSGDSGQAIGVTLQKAGVVKSVNAFVDATKADPKSSSIQPGDYKLKLQMSSSGAVQALLDPANRVVNQVLIKEGLRKTQIVDAIAAQTKITKADLEAALADPTSIGLPSQAQGKVEGWLFPATYDVDPKMTAQQLLTQMVSRAVKELGDLGVAPDKWESTIITASLVQAESGSAQDAPKIARVLENRLQQKMPLQLDTTVNYALNRTRVGVTIKDTQVQSPYNTYLKPGLPVGAICSPGQISLSAVINPAPGDWLYFVATDPDKGITEYGKTVGDFNRLQQKLNQWLKAHPGR